MSWVRAVWMEGNHEEEGTVPDILIKNDQVFWPPVANSLRYIKERKSATDKWKKFPVVKIKLRSDSYNECEFFDETTTAEVSEVEDNGKKIHKKKSFGTDFVSEMADDVDHDNMLNPKTRRSEKEADIPTLPPQPKKICPQFQEPGEVECRSRSRSRSFEKDTSKISRDISTSRSRSRSPSVKSRSKRKPDATNSSSRLSSIEMSRKRREMSRSRSRSMSDNGSKRSRDVSSSKSRSRSSSIQNR